VHPIIFFKTAQDGLKFHRKAFYILQNVKCFLSDVNYFSIFFEFFKKKFGLFSMLSGFLPKYRLSSKKRGNLRAFPKIYR
jgi:hypothetical protein